jgi:hypothetical protein
VFVPLVGPGGFPDELRHFPEDPGGWY